MQDATNNGLSKTGIAKSAGFALLILMSSPSLAFDCSKAATDIEVAICGDETAKAANERMGSAYSTVRGALDADGKKMLLDGQRAWLSYRDARCGSGATCLAEQSDERADALEKTPAGMAPFFLYQQGKENSFEVRILGYRFGAAAGRAETAYTSWIDSLIDSSPFGDPPDDGDPHQSYEHEVMVDITRLDERLISAVSWSSGYTGGAHPNSWSDAFNADRKTGVIFDPAAHFDNAGLSSLTDECAKSLVGEQSDTYGDVEEAEALRRLEENFPGAVAEGIKTGPRWHFDGEGAHVRYDSYAVAPYSSGAFECAFSYARLREAAPESRLFSAPDPGGPAQ